jgi:hypothetical protein
MQKTRTLWRSAARAARKATHSCRGTSLLFAQGVTVWYVNVFRYRFSQCGPTTCAQQKAPPRGSEGG